MTETKDIREVLRSHVEDRGFSLFGVADVTAIRSGFNLSHDLKSRFIRALSLGKRLLYPVLEDIDDKPTPLYFHHYRQLNFFLDREAFLLASTIQDLGFEALPIPASQVLDWKAQNSHVSHKRVGRQAGLGWIGRNNLLVNPNLGARFRLVTVLTDIPLEADKPLEQNCGLCRRCLATCPARAIKETAEDFDHMACFEMLKEFRNSGIVGQYICGICVRDCPGRKTLKA